jgi:hypothetical protein
MAAINGNRPRRVNNDGKSVTETRIVTADLLPGSFAVISATTDEFVQAKPSDGRARLYIMNVDTIQGRRIEETIPAGESGVGDYVEPGRQFAALAVKGSKLVKDTPLYLNDAGILTTEQGAPEDGRRLIGYSQEVYTVPADKDAHVLMRTGTAI